MSGARPRVGLALGSGGARGWCHIGVLRALDRLGVRPDVVAGASMGALVGAAMAAGRLEALADWAVSQTRASYLGLLDIRLTGGGLGGGGFGGGGLGGGFGGGGFGGGGFGGGGFGRGR